jgi:hypothetical protein
MFVNSSVSIDAVPRRGWLRFMNRAAVLLLLLAVPALSTLAKNSWYLPRANTGHYLIDAVKMRVAHPPTLLARRPLRLTAKVVSPRPQVRRHQEPELAPESPSISVTVSLQHRSPPALHI